MLTHQIQSRSIRQVNEQVLPAIIIGGLFFVLAVIAMVRTFGDAAPAPRNTGSWTASIDISDLLTEGMKWHWAANIRDTLGESFGAAGGINIINNELWQIEFAKPAPKPAEGNGYILSATSDFSTEQTVFSHGQNIYLKIWSEKVNYDVISDAVWILSNHIDEEQKITVKLSNSNTETIGRLLMSKFVLPFEVVSVLLLAALLGAIVIARKDD